MRYASGEEYDGFWANGRQATEEEAAAAEDAQDGLSGTSTN